MMCSLNCGRNCCTTFENSSRYMTASPPVRSFRIPEFSTSSWFGSVQYSTRTPRHGSNSGIGLPGSIRCLAVSISTPNLRT